MHACVNVHTVHVDVCGHNDVRGNNELADALSQACGHQGQKHVVCLCVCVIISGCVGWERVLFSKS